MAGIQVTGSSGQSWCQIHRPTDAEFVPNRGVSGSISVGNIDLSCRDTLYRGSHLAVTRECRKQISPSEGALRYRWHCDFHFILRLHRELNVS